jgi:hypothetical protein
MAQEGLRSRVGTTIVRRIRSLDERSLMIVAGLVYLSCLAIAAAFARTFIGATLYATLGALLAFLVIGISLAGQVEDELHARDRRLLLDWTTNLAQLSAPDFERLVAEVFRRTGWTVHERGRHGAADGNIDLELAANGQRVIVQCKRWSGLVGVKEVRELGGTRFPDGGHPDRRYLVALSGFSDEARILAEQQGIWLIDGATLKDRVDSVRRTEPCPLCAQPMHIRRSQYGWWLRCPVRTCKGKRDLGHEAGEVVRLLLRS